MDGCLTCSNIIKLRHLIWQYKEAVECVVHLTACIFLEDILQGLAAILYQHSETVPFKKDEDSLHNLFLLVDSVYPMFLRFIHGMRDSIFKVDKIFTAWQEDTKTGMERDFGVIQSSSLGQGIYQDAPSGRYCLPHEDHFDSTLHECM